MPIRELDEIRDAILARAKAGSCQLEGPADTVYGIGWKPTISFWSGKRRIHFYIDWSEEEWDDVWGIAEIAESGKSDTKQVWETRFRTVEEAWDLTRQYIVEQHPFPTGPSDQWKVLTKGSHDSLIPDPPNNYGASNFGPWVVSSKANASDQPVKEFTLDNAIQQPSAIALVRVMKPPNMAEPGLDTPVGCLGAFFWRWFRKRDIVEVQTIERFKGAIPEVFRFRVYDYSMGMNPERISFPAGERTLVFLDWDQSKQEFQLASQMPLRERGSGAFAETFVRSSSFWRGFDSEREGERRFIPWHRLRTHLLAKCASASGE